MLRVTLPLVRVDPSARARTDKSIQGWKRLVAEKPDEGWALVSAVIRNTYRTLMTRGMRSCWVWACDPGLQEYIRSVAGTKVIDEPSDVNIDR